jgi:methylated-DNA-protein-cysteine methyltransferase-like protein
MTDAAAVGARQSAAIPPACQIQPEARHGEPLLPRERIWQVVAAIPRGRVATYGQIARLAGLPSHARYVGRTLGNLPPGSRLPWHRVVNARLRISPRDDGAMSAQKALLENEGISFVGSRVAREHLWDY